MSVSNPLTSDNPAPLLEPSLPLRVDLCGPRQLDEVARQLALAATVASSRPTQALLRRFWDNSRQLHATHALLARRLRDSEALPPEAEWLLDNFYLVEDVLREIQTDLPRGYYQELPALASGPFEGMPRVYEMAAVLVAHTDSMLDDRQLPIFVQAYQAQQPLTIGELWAFPTMLRLALVENLRRLCEQTQRTCQEWDEGRKWGEIIAQRGDTPATLLPAQPSDPFLVSLFQALRDQAPDREEQRWLAEHGRLLPEILRREHQRQAANQVTVGNCITSLRLLGVVDWSTFFESVSLVEATLQQDPAGVYPKQDFATRDRCRRELERLARGSNLPETKVAQRVLTRAKVHQEEVAYYLLGPGREPLAQELLFRPRWRDNWRSWLLHHPEPVYFGLLLMFTTTVVGALLWWATPQFAWLVALLAVLPASELAVQLTNYLICKLLPPRVLPRLALQDGIPKDCVTFVVIPALIGKPEDATNLAEHLELHYLSNPDEQLRFALLTDFTDAPAEVMPSDDACIAAGLAAIRRLNERYPLAESDRFYFLHRQRQWNSAQGCWMGWERKRGKLHEFNRLLRGDKNTSYTIRSGDLTLVPHVPFVLTLDADTVLPRDAARQLISILAHPLNRPQLSADGRRVVAGYALLQPRVSFRYRTGFRSWFAALFANSAGIDPYSSAVSDPYMDLFGRGSYTGKGLYDVDAFEATAGQAFPDNAILSHDLIESNYARCGLVTNVEVFDEFPARYHAYARREHRWVRGDWQLLPWLAPRVPLPGGGSAPNILPALERWKVIDNLRRSLVPPVLVSLLILGWALGDHLDLGCTLLALAVYFLPLVLQLGEALRQRWRVRPDVVQTPYARGTFWATAGQGILLLAFLPNQAWLMLDAISRTLYRLFLSRQRLLEWESAAVTEARLNTRPQDFLLSMWPAEALTLVALLLVSWLAPWNLLAAGPVLLLWLSAPLLAYWVSLPRTLAEAPLTAAQTRELRCIARRTWNFFETFVGSEDNWLPPDNYQEHPRGVVAHRTSPTNIGMFLLSTLGAHDLGYITLPQLIERLHHTFNTLDLLEKYRGHLLNWYETTTLQPLHPRYVSSVDSGNLLACLLALRAGLLEKSKEPIPAPATPAGGGSVAGLADTIELLADALPDGMAAMQLRAAVQISPALADSEDNPAAAAQRWESWLTNLAEEVKDVTREVAPESEAAWWTQALLQQIEQRLAEVRTSSERPKNEWQSTKEEDSFGPGSNGLETSGAQRWSPGHQLEVLAQRAQSLAEGMDFRFLYNEKRDLFAVGYNCESGKLDQAHYDLLASEACLTSFLAVARGTVPRRHWFQLGRLSTWTANRVGLLSWGGTMFEYLMPRLLLAAPRGTLLEVAQRAAITRQEEYGRQLELPWGVSESGFYLLDAAQDYQYQAFGVPGLGLKRGLGHDRVVAPYATLLAVMLEPRAALANLHHLAQEGGAGRHGFYEAIDYTPERLFPGERQRVVRSYMAHHQGMALVALVNRLLADPMPRRLRATPAVQASELLLEERVPVEAPRLQPGEGETRAGTGGASSASPGTTLPAQPMRRRLTNPNTQAPRTHLLSNGQYTVMITNAGTGFSRCQGIDVTRWRADPVADNWGQFVYLREHRTGAVWSAGYQPLPAAAEVTRPKDQGPNNSSSLVLDPLALLLPRHAEYEAIFAEDKADLRRVEEDMESILEITVAPDKNVEVRRLTLRNRSNRPREIEVTSYAEIALLPHEADLAHPAFGKLFIETEWVPATHALLAHRRPRSAEETPIWAFHVLALPPSGIRKQEAGVRSQSNQESGSRKQSNQESGSRKQESGVGGQSSLTPASWPLTPEFETDRGAFLGRRRGVDRPRALAPGSPELGGHVGAVLDPIFSLRVNVTLEPGSETVIALTTGVAQSRAEALTLADQFQTLAAVTRAFELAWARSRMELRDLRLATEDAHLFQRLAGHILYPTPALRATDALHANRQGQAGLWPLGLSGDLPIALLRLVDTSGLGLLRQLLQAQAYWREKGLAVDLVVLLEDAAGYYDALHEEALHLGRAHAAGWLEKTGGVFLRKGGAVGEAGRTLLLSAARVVLHHRAPLAAQLDWLPPPQPLPPALAPLVPTRLSRAPAPTAPLVPELLCFNGIGGFVPDGQEYVIAAAPAAPIPPAPWCNVIANPNAGFLVSDSGSGCTWVGNSQTNRLTPWHNDPVSDPPGEVLYLRDEETGDFWSPTPLPCGGPTRVRHGQGYTMFESIAEELEQEMTLFVPPRDPVKLILLRVRNRSRRERRLSATFYVEWVLGTVREKAGTVVTEEDPDTGTLLARNPWNPEFPGAVAFLDVSAGPRTLTGDRAEFLGRNRTLARPLAMENVELSGRTGPAAGCGSPCGALQTPFTLRPGQETTLVFVLGQGENVSAARSLALRYRQLREATLALQQVVSFWAELLTTITVKTPQPAFDLLVNRWLLYQTLSCRIWGRTAFYQSGGAYGYRDQLQDVLALLHAQPDLARQHILRAAGHQFAEGDVQHWWHPPHGQGVRSRCSDDFLWLPYAVAQYVRVTGDLALLDVQVAFLQGEPLAPGEQERYGPAQPAQESATLYEHCRRALDHGWQLGPHGLPLMGSCDWNDGMNRVGAGGKGESVWVAWFQITCLREFAELARARGDRTTGDTCRQRAEQLEQAVEEHAWDGAWYRRAYFDDGTPLGSSENSECQIDSLAQSWAVLARPKDEGPSTKSACGGSNKAKGSRTKEEELFGPSNLVPGTSLPRHAAAVDAAVKRLIRWEERLLLLFAPPFDASALAPGDTLDPGYIKGYPPGVRENGGQYTHAALWLVQALAELERSNEAHAAWDLLNPIQRTLTVEQAELYRVEPYVVAADVYGKPPHTGRGGWTWYTGSAGWMYRVAVESLLGIQRAGKRLTLKPRLPKTWPEVTITYRYGRTTYQIHIANLGSACATPVGGRRSTAGGQMDTAGAAAQHVREAQHTGSGPEAQHTGVALDGQVLTPWEGAIELVDDGQQHQIEVTLGNAAPTLVPG